jgi:hypothetical protein
MAFRPLTRTAKAAHEPEDMLALSCCQRPGLAGGRLPSRREAGQIAGELAGGENEYGGCSGKSLSRGTHHDPSTSAAT